MQRASMRFSKHSGNCQPPAAPQTVTVSKLRQGTKDKFTPILRNAEAVVADVKEILVGMSFNRKSRHGASMLNRVRDKIFKNLMHHARIQAYHPIRLNGIDYKFLLFIAELLTE